MGGLTLQKRLAAEILKVGVSRVAFDPEHLEDIKNAITRADIKKLISKGYIRVKTTKIKKPEEKKKRRKGPGRRKGAKGTRITQKEAWMKTIRPLRRMLKELRDKDIIEPKTYRQLYRMIKSGSIKSRAHLRLYLKQRGIEIEAGSNV